MSAVLWSLRIMASLAVAAGLWISLEPARGEESRSSPATLREGATAFQEDHSASDSLVELIAASALFRANREPPAGIYRADPSGVVQPPPEPLPVLVLRGLLLGGPSPVAIIDGVPGSAGQVLVRSGDRPGDGSLRIQSVGPSGVIVSGRDTLWHLVLKGTPR